MQESNPTAGESLLRLPAVCSRLGIGRSAIYDLVKRGELCQPVKLGQRVSVWPASAIDAFIAARIASARRPG